MSELNKKVSNAIKLMKLAEQTASEKPNVQVAVNELNGGGYLSNNQVEISYSGGKDSDVILRLAQLAGIKHVVVHKLTTIDPSGTVKHVRENGGVVIKPEITFFKLMEKKGFPTRRARFCCEKIKERKCLDVSVQGIRKSESSKRAALYSEPVICRNYGRHEHVDVFLPILDWTDADIKEFIENENIKLHPLYYNCNGDLCVERRLGCLCCPLQSSRRLRIAFEEHPLMVRAWVKHGLVWWNSHPDTKSHEKFQTIYDLFFHNTFCESYQEYIMKTTGLFGRMDCKSFLEDHFKVDLP